MTETKTKTGGRPEMTKAEVRRLNSLLNKHDKYRLGEPGGERAVFNSDEWKDMLDVMKRKKIPSNIYLNLTGADCKDVLIEGVDFGASTFKEADMRCITMENCSFRGANLRRVDFTNAGFTNCDFSRADLSYSRFDNVYFESGYIFTDAELSGISAMGCEDIITASSGSYYQMVMVHQPHVKDAKVLLHCGCRRFSNIQDAYEHWHPDKGILVGRPIYHVLEVWSALRHLVYQAQIRGWKVDPIPKEINSSIKKLEDTYQKRKVLP